MTRKRGAWRLAVAPIVFVAIIAIGSATAVAAELDDYRWVSRPLLLFAPTNGDPRLVETLRRIDASRCDFDGRDMVLGVVVSEGDSTLDGHAISPPESQRLMNQFATADDAFSVLLIGKDGGEKLRVDEVPDLRRVYGVIDGMPMRGREMTAQPNGC